MNSSTKIFEYLETSFWNEKARFNSSEDVLKEVVGSSQGCPKEVRTLIDRCLNVWTRPTKDEFYMLLKDLSTIEPFYLQSLALELPIIEKERSSETLSLFSEENKESEPKAVDEEGMVLQFTEKYQELRQQMRFRDDPRIEEFCYELGEICSKLEHSSILESENDKILRYQSFRKDILTLGIIILKEDIKSVNFFVLFCKIRNALRDIKSRLGVCFDVGWRFNPFYLWNDYYWGKDPASQDHFNLLGLNYLTGEDLREYFKAGITRESIVEFNSRMKSLNNLKYSDYHSDIRFFEEFEMEWVSLEMKFREQLFLSGEKRPAKSKYTRSKFHSIDVMDFEEEDKTLIEKEEPSISRRAPKVRASKKISKPEKKVVKAGRSVSKSINDSFPDSVSSNRTILDNVNNDFIPSTFDHNESTAKSSQLLIQLEDLRGSQ